MLLGRRLAVRQHAEDITKPVRFDVHAGVEAWGTNITRVVPSIVWRRTGAAVWTTNSLVPHLDWRQTRGAASGAEGGGVITVTNDAALVATNLPAVNLAAQDKMEYYLLLQYEPDDADPARKAAGYRADGSLRLPEIRFYPDNSEMIANAWTCIAKTYAPQPLTNTVNGISDVWINEASRNAAAGAADDFIELAGPAGTSLANWVIEVQDLSLPDTRPAIYPLTGALNTGATNGYAFFVLGGTSVSPNNQALTNALPEACGVTLRDAGGNIRYRLAFNGGLAGFETLVESGTADAGEASWSAIGEGNPGNRQYAWVGSAVPTPGAPNRDDDPEQTQKVENGGPIGTGVTGMTAVTGTTDRMAIEVSGAADADGVATGAVVVVQGVQEIARLEFPGTSAAVFTLSNLTENTRYDARVVYTDTKGASREGGTVGHRYTLLSTPAAPALADSTPSSVTVSTPMPNLAGGGSGAWFTGPSGSSGWLQVDAWECTGLSPNVSQTFTVKGRNGDGIETAVSPATNYYTLANAPDAGLLTSSSPWTPSLRVSVTNLTDGGDAAFGNPGYTCYMLIHSNVMTGAGGYVTTNGMAVQNARVSAQKVDATWLPITGWESVTVFGDAVTNDFYLVARNEDGVETAAGPAARGVLGMQFELSWSGQVADKPGEAAFAGRFMNPVAEVTTNHLALEFSTNAGIAWSSAVIKSGSVQLGVGADPGIDNGQAYPIRSVATEAYSNTLTRAVWSVTNNLTWGVDHAVSLRLSGIDGLTGGASPVTNAVIDLSPPEARLTGLPDAYTRDTAVSVAVGTDPAAEDDDVVTAYRWMLEREASPDWTTVAAWSAATPINNPITRPGLAEGRYRLSVVGRDEAGNWQTEAAATRYEWNVDRTAPTAQTADFVNRPLPTDLNTNAITFVMVTNTPLNAVRWEYTVTNSAGGVVGSARTPVPTNAFTVVVTADDTYGIAVWAYDQAGNAQAVGAPTIHAWETDFKAPTNVVFQGVPAYYTRDTGAAISVTNAAGAPRRDQVARWVGVLDGGSAPARPPFSLPGGGVTNFTGLADGLHSLHVWARDPAGNWMADADAAVTNWWVDTVTNAAWFVESVPAYTNTRTPRIVMGTAGAVDAVAWRYQWAGQTAGWTSNPTQTVAVAADGTYTNLVWARDAAGNTQTVASVNIWRADTTAPAAGEFTVVSRDGIAPWSRNRTTNFVFGVEVALPALFGGGDDTNATYRYQFNAGPQSGWLPVSSNVTVVSAEGGAVTNTLTVWTTDWLGNGPSVPKSFTWIVDTVAPVAELDVTPPANGAWQTNTAWTVVVSGEQVEAYRWTLDDPSFPAAGETPQTLAFQVSGLSEAPHTVRVWGRDAAGNWQTTATEYTKTVDVTPPAAVLSGWPAEYTTQTWARVGVTNAPGMEAKDTVARYRWQLAGPSPRMLTESPDLADIQVSGLADGAYTLSVWGYDPAGNLQRDVAPTTAAWTVDTAAPTAAFLVQPPTDLNTNTITFTMVYDGNPTHAVRWEYTVTNSSGGVVGGALTAVDTNRFTVTVPDEDTYGIAVWASDRAGNRQPENEPTTHAWEADFTAPTDFLLHGVPAQYTRETGFSIYATNAPGQPRRNQVVQWAGVLNGGANPARPPFALPGGAATNFAGLADGAYTLHVWACDHANNWTTDGAATVTNWVVDTVTNAAWFVESVPAYTNTRTPRIVMGTAGAVDAVAWRYQWAGQTAGWTSNPTQTVAVAADGTYTNLVWARDAAGNTQAVASVNIWRADTTAPTADEVSIVLESPEARTRYKETNFTFRVDVALPALFGVSGNDTNATYRYQVKNQFTTFPLSGPLPVASRFDVVSDAGPDPSVDITNTVSVWAADWLGNASGTPKTFTWIVDVWEPTAHYRVHEPDTAGTWQTNRVWNVSVTGDAQVVSYRWTVDASAETNVVATRDEPFATPELAEGPHTLKVWGCDEAGNWQSDPTEYTRIVDVTPPEAVLSGLPAAYTTQTWIRAGVTHAPGMEAKDTVTRYRWRLAGPTSFGVRESASAALEELEVTGLTDGAYTLSVWGCDPAGNLQRDDEPTTVAWTVDTQAPSAAFAVPPARDINTNRVEFVLVSDGSPTNAVSWRYAVTNAGGAVIVSETVTRDNHIVVSNLADAVYGIWITASDEAGNEQADALRHVWEVDREAIGTGMVRLTGVPEFYTNALSAAVSVTNLPGAARKDTVAEWVCVLNGGKARPAAGFLPGGAVTNLNGFIADATNTLYVWARDPAGNWMPDSAAVATNWFVDRTPPSAAFVRTPATATNTPTVGFVMEADGPLGAERWTYGVTRAGAQVTSGASADPGFSVGVSEDGTYTVHVTAYDRAGNASSAAAECTWTLDRVAPAAEIEVRPSANGPWQTNDVWQVKVTGDADVAAYRWTVNDPAMPAAGETLVSAPEFTADGLAQGANTLRVWGRDAAGNWQTTATEYTKTVDTRPPAAVLENVPAPYTRADGIAVSVTNAAGAETQDTVAQYRWRLAFEGNVVAEWSEPADASAVIQAGTLEDGGYGLAVVGRDPAGNWQPEPGTVTNWVRDTVAPEAWFEVPIPGFTNQTTVSFTLGSSDPTDSVMWKFEVPGVTNATAAWSPAATHTVTVPGTGIYTNRVWGRDAAGNEQAEPTKAVWVVDVTAPEPGEIHVAPVFDGVRTNQTGYTFEVSVDLPEWQGGGTDTGAFYQWSFNGSPRSAAIPVSEPLELTSAEGPGVTNTLTVWAADASLNWQDAGLTRTWVIDTVAPQAAFDPAPTNLLASLEAVFTLSAADPDAAWWRFEVPGVTNGVSATNVIVVTLQQDGEHALSVWARDVAGNEQAVPLAHTWRADTTDPQATFADVPGALVNTPSVGFTVSNDLDSVAWTYTVFRVDGTPGAVAWGRIDQPDDAFTVTVNEDGLYRIELIGHDAAGNARATPVTPGGVFTWTLDTTPPDPGARFVSARMPADPTNLTAVTAWLAADADIEEWRVSLFKQNGALWDAVVEGLAVTNLNGGAAPTEAGVHTFAGDGSDDGVYRLEALARDAAHNWQSVPGVDGVWTWRADRTAPVAAFDPVPAALMASLTALFTVADGTDAVTWRFAVDGGVTNGVSAGRAFGVTLPQDGEYTLSVWARDAAGNEQTVPLTHTWRADTVPPDAVFAAVPPTLVNSNAVTFAVADDGDSVSWNYVVTNAALGEVVNGWIHAPTNAFTVTLPPVDGEYAIALYGRDLAGNSRADGDPVVPGGVFRWTLDTAPPSPGARFVSALMPADPTNLTAVTAWLAADADIEEWRVSLFKQNGALWDAVVEGLAVTNLNGGAAPTEAGVHTLADDGSEDGVYRLTVVGRDAAFNWQTGPTTDGTHDWTFDRTPPVAVFAEEPVTPTQNRTTWFVASNAVERVVRWKYRVKNNLTALYTEWTETVDPEFAVTVYDNGVYTVELLGCDAAGNWQTLPDPERGRLEWTVAEVSHLVEGVVRNTLATNGSLRVELVFSLTNAVSELILAETLPVSAAVTEVGVANAALLAQRPEAGVATNTVRWILAAAPDVREVRLTYTVPGLATRAGLSGTVKWYEVSENSEGVRQLGVLRGTHEEAATGGYAAWAAARGLGAASQAEDGDGDGQSNEAEYWADTDPLAADSLFRLAGIRKADAASVTVQVHAGPEATLAFGWKRALSDAGWTPTVPRTLAYDAQQGLWQAEFGVLPAPGGLAAEGAFLRAQALPREE